jgi:hypothetical protein
VNPHRLLLAIILVYAAGFRLMVLDRPFDYDAEGSGCLYGVLARNYLRFDWAQTHGMPVLTVGHSSDAPIVFYRDHPPLVPLLIVPFYALFGVGAWQTRIPFALATLAAVYVFYRLTARVATRRVGLIAAAVFAATPMTLYFGGFPDVIGMPLILFVLLSVSAYLRFHRDPGVATLVPFVAAFIVAGVCDWEAYIVVPVFLSHFVATKPFRQWPWVFAFCVAACAVFAAVYVYIALATNSRWDWMAPLFSRRSAIVGENRFTLAQWLRAALAFNRAYHTLALLFTSGLWVVIYGWRFRRAEAGATVARLLLAWGVLYILIGSKAVYDHEWPWLLLTPGIVVATALLIESMLDAAATRGFARAVGGIVAALVVCFASWSAYTTFKLLYPVERLRPETPMQMGRAIQAAAPDPADVALLVTGEEAEPQLWFYGDRAVRTKVWSIWDFERRLRDDTVDLMYDFEPQPWQAAATGIVFPKAWDHGAGSFRAYIERRYPLTQLPADLADKFEVFDLR